jgi:hypothetical protein
LTGPQKLDTPESEFCDKIKLHWDRRSLSYAGSAGYQSKAIAHRGEPVARQSDAPGRLAKKVLRAVKKRETYLTTSSVSTMLGAFQQSFLRKKDGFERVIHGDTVGLGRPRNTDESVWGD